MINRKIQQAYLRELSTNIEMSIKYINASIELIDKKSKVCYRLLHQAESQLRKIHGKYAPEKILDKLPPDEFQHSLDSSSNKTKTEATTRAEATNMTTSSTILADADRTQINSPAESFKQKEGISLQEFARRFIQIFQPHISRTQQNAKSVIASSEKLMSRSEADDSLLPEIESENKRSLLMMETKPAETQTPKLAAMSPDTLAIAQKSELTKKNFEDSTTKMMESLLVEQFKECKGQSDQLQLWVQLALRKGYSLGKVAGFARLEVAQVQLLAKLPNLSRQPLVQTEKFMHSDSSDAPESASAPQFTSTSASASASTSAKKLAAQSHSSR